MKRVQINRYYKGLVFKRNQFVKLLGEGEYWLCGNRQLSVYDMSKPFVPTGIELDVLLKYGEIAAELLVVDVADNEIAVQYENNLFKTVLPPGRYAFWKDVVEYRFVKANTGKVEITEIGDVNLLSKAAFAPYIRQYVVEPYEKALLYKNGVFECELEKGTHLFWKNSISLFVYRVDTRQLQAELNGQEILTKDKASLRINFSYQYKVADIHKAAESKEYEKQLYALLQLALRELVATYTLDELLDKRDALNPLIMESVAGKTAELGILLTGCGIRDIILPGDMKEIINQVLIAEKRAQANIIMRREETASTRSLLNTARLMEENDMLRKLKEMEYVEKIADKISSISLSGGNDLVNQMKQIFIPAGGKKE
jgi:regulator of protease activity HflC (stomatin/prohibitin superfamily)